MQAEISQFFTSLIKLKMEKTISKTNKATLIAAALIITGATAIFGTYAASDEQESFSGRGQGPLGCYEMVNNLTEDQKAKFDEAHTLMQDGDVEGARAIMDELGFKGPGPNFERLTDEQKAAMEKARQLFKEGDSEGAKALLDEAGIKPPRKHGFMYREIKRQGVNQS